MREIKLDHPPVNALRLELFTALEPVLESACGDGPEAIVLSGSARTFSAGLDIPHLLESERSYVLDTFRGLFACIRSLGTSTLPVAAAVTGHALAGGVSSSRSFVTIGSWREGAARPLVSTRLRSASPCPRSSMLHCAGWSG